MQTHRLWITTTLCWFFLLFNIERLIPAVNIASFIYVLATAAGACMLSVRRIRNWPFGMVASAFVVVAFVTKCALGYNVNVESLPLTLLEMTSVAVTLWLCRNIAQSADEFVHSSDQLLHVMKAMSVPTLREAEQAMSEEIRRARRHERPLTVVTMSVEDTPDFDLGKLLNEMVVRAQNECVLGTLGQLLVVETKSHDILARDGNKFLMLLPETDAEQATAMTNRLETEALTRFGIRLKSNRVSFGSDELTMTSLLNIA